MSPIGEPALGIDLGGTKIEAVVLDAAGAACWRERVPTPPQHRYESTLDALAALVERAEAATGRAAGTLRVGIGMPGTLDASGRVKNANSTYLNGRPFEADLRQRLGRAVPTANDANCMALSEAVDGAGAGFGCVFGVILGTGVGGGLVMDRVARRGPNGLAGEWGHTPLPWPTPQETNASPRCFCGRRGCIETWLSGPGLAADHARQDPDAAPASAAEIARAARAGDPQALHSLRRHAERLARALAVIVDVIDPDVIVLAGGLSQLPGLVGAVQSHWADWVFGAGVDEPVRTRLAVARHGDASGVRGAAWLAAERRSPA